MGCGPNLMEKHFFIPPKYLSLLLGCLIFFGLYLTSLYNYLLFHSLAEIFSIVIAFSIFIVAWNSRRFLDNNYLLFVGIAYLFVASLDLVHTLAYTGMNIFKGYATNLATQLWIATRYMESISLFIAPLSFRRRLNTNGVFLGYTVVTIFLLLSIFYWDIFPICFIEGIGLTPFKKISEYIISLILLASIALLLKSRGEFDRKVLQWIVWSIILTILSEMAFTFYIHAYGFSNLVGHYFKIISFYFIYKALIETGLSRPYDLLFRNLRKSEEALRLSFEETKQRQAEVSALLRGARAVLEYHEFKDSARSIFDSCKKLIGATAGYIALLSKNGSENEVLFLDSGGLPCTVDPNLPMPIRGLREVSYRTGKAVYDNGFTTSQYMEFMPDGHARLDNVLFAPLMIGRKVIGLLGLANKSGGFVENDAHLASAFGELAAVALHNSRTLEALEHNEERYRSVVQTANDAIISADSQGNIIFWNKSAESIFGYSYDEVIGKALTFIIPERFHEAHQEAMDRVVSTGKSNIIGRTVEMAGLRRDGSEFPVEISLASWQTREGIFSTGVIRDITERKKAEEALRRSRDELEIRVQERTAELAKSNQALQFEIEERKQAEEALRQSEVKYRIIADNTYDWEWWLGPEGRFAHVSPSCKGITGYDPEEFLKDPDLIFRIIYPEDRPIFISHQNEVDNKRTGGEVEFRIVRPDGSYRWIAHACQPVFDDQGHFLGHRGTNRDITERQLAREALQQSEEQLRYLSSQLLSAEEKERKRIARELHDGIGQSLTAIKFRVENMLQQINKGKAKRMAEPLETIIPLIQQSIEESRRVQMDLRPSILDDLGILATLSWFCREFQTTYSEISIEKRIDINEDEVPDSLKTVIYRISQETLNNVAKHSKADLVHLILRKLGGKIELVIQDNGDGFDLKERFAREGSGRGLGLTSMRERTELSGGSFEIESTVGKGTTIKAQWPI
jgi:PAS domain S-box-containing protein